MINTTNKLRLSCQLDRPAERVTMTVRCQTQTEFPNQGLTLVDKSNKKLFAEKDFDEWSFPVENGNSYYDATNFDWLNDFQLTSVDGQHKFDFFGSSVLVFLNGSEFDLPYLIQVDSFPPASYKEEFWIICKESQADFIKSFVYEVVQIQVSVGLPNGWVMFSLK